MAEMCGGYGGPALEPMVVTVNSDEVTVRELIEKLREEMTTTNKLMTQMQAFLFGPDISKPCDVMEPPKSLREDISLLLDLVNDTNKRAGIIVHILGV